MVVGFSRSKHIIKRGTTTLTSYSNPNWIAFRCSHNQISQKNTLGNRKINSIKIVILLDIYFWCHFNTMLIMESSAKWLIWMLKNSKKTVLGFGFNKRSLNLNNIAWKVINFVNY
jgi:hypothetical protein